MISVEQALQTIANSAQDFGVEEIPLLQSLGRILKEEIKADRDFPPFHRVAMDGIVIDYSQFQKGQRSFKIEGIQPAGSEQVLLKNPSNCIEVMTGAVLPMHANAVIRYEDIRIEKGVATILLNEICEAQNIHQQGKDSKKGQVLIKQNTRISAAEIGVLATVGKDKVKVAKNPKVMIVSTGNELVDVGAIPLAHQIRRSNVFTLVSLLERLHIPSETAHISDDKWLLKAKVETYLTQYDVLLFSGAVSKGKYDFLPEVLDQLGVEKLFHTVAQRPGKPFWFGKSTLLLASHQDVPLKKEKNQTKNTLVFAFPGNPISTFVNCLVYFYPWYHKSIGLKEEEETAILAEDVSFKPSLTYFLQVTVNCRFGHLIATPIQGNGSGDLASLVHSNAFIQLPKEQAAFVKGAAYKIIRYR